MRFRFEQEFPGGREAVQAVFLDPGFLASLRALPKLGEPELLEQRPEGGDGRVFQRTRYRFTGQLSPAVTRVIDPAKLVWVEECTHDPGAGTATFRIVPEHYADRLEAGGTYRFEPAGPEVTRRVAEGDLSVRYPIVGRAVERAIVSGLGEHLDDESALVADWLARSR